MSEQSTSPEMSPEHAAIHEAGHAVVGDAVGLEIKSADIIRIGGRAGIVHIVQPAWIAVERDPTSPRAKAYLQQCAVMDWAGYLAEERFTGIDKITSLHFSMDMMKEAATGVGDFASLLLAAELSADSDVGRLDFVELTRAQALDVLQREWSSVELIADALLESTVLTGPAIRGLISMNKSSDVQPVSCAS